mmetsp:Transcript_7544/g.28351  ORF Transcript_7544/g.28351 Transcript_7544/m.28351 type:complete len:80 (-) Transcript_7544:566-805(-)
MTKAQSEETQHLLHLRSLMEKHPRLARRRCAVLELPSETQVLNLQKQFSGFKFGSASSTKNGDDDEDSKEKSNASPENN